ncbi:WD40 repeat-like protein [Fomitiporia mediterranea MF3/22]|uniref:WD40 repeat-like protein n=1 Tax=Fomitiporia mediterranea (strain MF3/22) TaxID=694068 RepID=UPI00044082D7|nr:WD40 repeat-like protein [Fomitiporia mediterranea MF3/22]EJD06306.1 WD40 repeat-like protein [Fomitiporia mediterranea MF3/22]
MNAFKRNTCLENTRVEVLNQIMGWLLSDTAQNILWLHGVAGSGKSTIATTIAENCRGMSRLGAFIFFRRADDTERQLVSLFRTIAYRLVMFDSSIAQQVKASVKKNDHITEAVAEVQFTRLLLDPLNAARDDVQGPVVIVIDALDECGTREARRILMSLLRREFGKLPTNYRCFITSRPEVDISTALSNRPGSVYELTLDSSSADSKRDVLRYIDHEMRRVIDESDVRVPDEWPWDTYMKQLARASEGLFIWASTAITLVSESPSRLRRLYELVNASHRLKGLDRLYKSVLISSGVISMDEPYSIARFTQILGLILLSRVPLTDATIDALLGLSSIEPSREILAKLQSVLVFRQGEPVHVLHTSFADFLMSSPCSTPCPIHHDPSDCLSGPWFSDVAMQSSLIAKRCFTIMKGGLGFNMCDLESSFAYNKDVVGIKDRISNKLPSHLQYACKYWAQHLGDAPYTRELLDELAAFAYEYLLYWLEVLSMLGQVGPIASRALLDGAKWCEAHDTGLSLFLRDASKLAATFAMPITESTPHIYVSMLPLMKGESATAAHYSKHISRMVEMNRIGTKPPPLWSKVLEGHTHYILTVSFSPDGKYIASGSWDGTVRMWDFESGEMVCHLFEGHQVAVNSLAFSPDSRLLVTGSWDKKVRIWDIESREVVSGPFEGHVDGVRTVAFAQDGKHIASGSGDMTIRVWDVENRAVSQVLEGHKGAVRSVAFSSDKKRIFSASEDKTIRVWNVETGQATGEPFVGHTKEIYCMSVSPNGRHLASGSCDNTVRVWDVESGQLVSGPFEHADSVYSVCFAPDGKRVVSGSADRTIIVWEVATGEIVSGPFTGHVGTIRSVAFSPDGSCIVSGCQDKTLRVWDASIGKIISDSASKHSDAVFSVAFSPDGSHIVSGSRDKTVRFWDASTGEAASAPFLGHTERVYSAVVSPDGRRIVSGSTDKTVIVWDIRSGKMVFQPFVGHLDMVNSVTFSTDGTRVVSGSNDRTIIIWNAENGKMIAQSEQVHKTGIRRVAFTPDSTLIASASVDNDVVIWNPNSGEIVSGPFKALQDSTFLYYAPLSFSPDGRRIASRSSNNDIIVRDLESGQIVPGHLKGHTDPVTSVSFSPDGAYIASGSVDRAVIIWDASSGKPVSGPYKGHSGGITCVAFSPDSARVVSCSFDGTIRIWAVSSNEGVSASSGETSDNMVALLSTVASGSINEGFAGWTLADNGWILGPQNELLLWLPPDIRSTLWRPQNAAVFSCEFSTKLNFRNAACGQRWKECFNPAE